MRVTWSRKEEYMAQEFEGLYVKFGANTVEFDNSVKGMNSALSTLKKDLQTLNKNLKFDPGNVDLLAKKMQNFQQQIEIGNKKIEELRKKQKDLGDDKIGTAEWQKLESEIGKTEAQLQVVRRSLEATEKQLKELTPGNIEHVNKKLDEMAEKAEKTANKIGKIKDGFEKAGNAAKPFSALAVAGLGASAVAAGNLQEQTAKTGAVFKEQTKEMDAFAKSSLENFNMAENTSRDIMNTYGAMGSGLGLTAKENAKLAKSLTGLTADTVAFNDVSSDRAKTALKGIYTGETESLKELGVVMTQANLENYAMNNGITTSIKDMTEAEKVTLRYNYVMDAMADAQGAAKREQDSFNGQIRYFKEQLIEIATRIGEQMMPVLEDLLKKVNDFVEKIANLDDKGFKNIAKALVAVAAVAPLLLGVAKILGVVQMAMNGWANALRLIKGTKFAAFLANTFGTAAMGPVVASILAIVGVLAAVGIALKQLWDRSETFRNAMLGIWESIKQSITNSVKLITGDKGLGGIKSTWEKVWGYLEPAWILFQELVGAGAVIIGEAVSMIAGVFEGLVSIVTGVMTKNAVLVDEGVGTIYSAVKKFVKNVMDYIQKIDWGGLAETAINGVINGLKGISEFLWDTFLLLFNTSVNLIQSIDWLALGKTVLDFVIKGISSLASSLWQTVQKLFNTALETIKNINWDNLGQTLMRLIIQGISAIGSMIWNTLRGIFSSAKNNSEKSIDWLGIGLTIINMIVQGITVLMGVIWKTLRGALTEAWSSAKNIDWASIGSAIINGITSRVSAIGSNIWNSIRNALNNAKEWASNISWSSVGGSIVNSIVSGITGLADKIYDKIVSAADTAKSWTSGLWDNITDKRSFDMQFNGSVVPNMQRMAMPAMGNYYNPVASVSGHTISISVDARGDNADMIARRVERAIVRRIQS